MNNLTNKKARTDDIKIKINMKIVIEEYNTTVENVFVADWFACIIQ